MNRLTTLLLLTGALLLGGTELRGEAGTEQESATEAVLACTSAPGEVRDLTLNAGGAIGWTAPLDLGGSVPLYDTLRSEVPWDFGASALCVESNDGADTQATDPGVPPTGVIFYYLIRAENECGPGPLGTYSNGFPRPPARPCGPCINDADCDDGTYCNGPESCDVPTMTCQAGTPPDCYPYVCDTAGDACFTTCSGDAECLPGLGCDGGICRKLDGEACGSDSECLSGFCTDGVCCESRCDGTCELCDGPGRVGFCDPVPLGGDPDEECPTELPSTCGTIGLCDGAGACFLYPSGTTCAAAACAGSTLSDLPDACDGAGTCADGGQQDCHPYICDPGTGSCRSSCGTSADCAAGYGCDAGVCKKNDGQACLTNPECLSGACCSNVCTDTSDDENHCGACGIVCQSQNGTNVCLAGTCNPTCNTGFDSCDGNPNNGCETSLRTTSNCGGCGVPCDIPNASESCSTGTCTMTSCNSSYSSCDGSTANGCEVYHKSYPNSCASPGSVISSCGDTSCGFICASGGYSTFATRTGRTSRWYRGRANECSDCCADVTARVILTPPSGTDYDLFLYSACGTLIGSSQNGGSTQDTVTFTKEDGCFGDDTSFDYWVEVRHWSGASCSNWTLAFQDYGC